MSKTTEFKFKRCCDHVGLTVGTAGQPKLNYFEMNRLKFVSLLLIGVFTFVFSGCNKDGVQEDESNLSLEKVLTLKFGLNVKQLSETSYKIGDENTSFIYTLISKDKATIKNSFNNSRPIIFSIIFQQ